VAGDNVDVCTEHLLTSFMGSNHFNPDNDSKKMSQLRIYVEMAFGRFVTKWWILHTALEVPLSKSDLVFQACCHFHNYCINEKPNASKASRIETAYNNNDTILGYIPNDTTSNSASGSILPHKLVKK
jgi:hypothetical protein